MDSSSDGSFAWTDASDDTTDNETMAKTDVNISQSGEESESGKTYKKKLQQRLFSGTDNDKTNETEIHQQKKRKLSQHYSDAENIETSKKKRIKTEPASDVDTQKVKKIHRSCETNGQHSPDDPYDENFLNLKVKNEQNFVVPSPVRIKKRKSKSVSCANDTSMSNDDGSELHQSLIEDKVTSSSQTLSEADSSHVEEGENMQDIEKPKKKKKKSKRKKEFSESEDNIKDSIIKDSFSAEETVVEKRIEYQNDDSTDELTNSNSILSDVQGNKLRSKKESLKDDAEKVANDNVSDENTDRKLRMSERITFEDEEDSDIKTKNTKTSSKTTKKKKSKLENFIESSLHLRPFCTKLPSALVVTDDDDVWVVRCPNEINAEAFQDKKWTLDSKCKIKLDGKAYEGDVDEHKSNMTILSAKNGKAIIRNITINGCIRLHRRIPKTHIQEDNIMVNNQSNFIPLPETKWRHPLFGINYKKAIKLPSQVVERLQEIRTEATVSSGKRKKKRDRKKLEDNEQESTTPKQEDHTEMFDPPEDLIQSNTTSKKKKKKRKLSKTITEELSPPRQKRVKHNPESAEAWESEKAIEENLFNF